jgi:hypothetical protein
MGAGGEKLLQPFRRLRDRVGARDPDDVESMGARGLDQCCLQARWIVQKSRLA